jgi:predicted DNA-binding transcriptional regulator AlpA
MLALWSASVNDSNSSVRLPTRKVLERFGICTRTLDRWLAKPDLKFPRPIVVNGRRYFALGEIEAWERSRAAQMAAA